MDYQQTSLFCFTETWLSKDVDFNLDGFNIICWDAGRTWKSVGDRHCMAVNKRWASNFTVRETESCKHYELMVVSFKPHYLPQESSQITVILVYVLGPDFTLAAEHVAGCYNRADNRTDGQPVFLLGDFNRYDISTQLPNLSQSPQGCQIYWIYAMGIYLMHILQNPALLLVDQIIMLFCCCQSTGQKGCASDKNHQGLE